MGITLGVKDLFHQPAPTQTCVTQTPADQRDQGSRNEDHTTQALHLIWNYMNSTMEASTSVYPLQTKPLGSPCIPDKYTHHRDVTRGGILGDVA